MYYGHSAVTVLGLCILYGDGFVVHSCAQPVMVKQIPCRIPGMFHCIPGILLPYQVCQSYIPGIVDILDQVCTGVHQVW